MALIQVVKKWETDNGQKIADAVEVKLNGHQPPIEKLDGSLTGLVNCEKLSLSTNLIEKLSNLQSLSKLRILSIGRNLIKSLAGVEGLAGTLEELWASYNLIEKLAPVAALKNLKSLFLSNNNVKDANEFNHLVDLPKLEDLIFIGCPIQLKLLDGYRFNDTLPQLKMLDCLFVVREEE